MATNSWSSRIRHDDDATYQEWRDEFVAKLALVGLAADETTVVTSSGSRPSANTEESYAVFHLDDAMHGTAPIYIRFGFGTHSGATAPRIQVTVGTSTDGSGVIGGTAKTTIRNILGSVLSITDVARQSWMCANEGFFGVFWKKGISGGSTGGAFLAVNRTCDSTGTPDARGAMVVWGAGDSSVLSATQALRFVATAAAFTARVANSAENQLGFFPQVPITGAVGADIQVCLGWTILPIIVPLFGVCGVMDSDIGFGNTFSTTLVGTSARVYIALAAEAGPFGPSAVSAGYPKFAMLWE